MNEPITRAVGVVVAVAYAAFIGWLFAAQPRSVTEAVGGVASGIGLYTIDAQAFADGIAYFQKDQFREARAAFARADPAQRDARTQFYIAYSFYREGWHRTHRDNALYQQGLEVANKAIALAPSGRLVVDDPMLEMHTADELKAELEDGLRLDAGDLNPLRVFDKRK